MYIPDLNICSLEHGTVAYAFCDHETVKDTCK